MSYPPLTQDDMFEGLQAGECSCKNVPANEKMEAIAEPSESTEEGTKCLPWVRIAVDPKRFHVCLAEARKAGRVESSQKLFSVMKDVLTNKNFMVTEDQEIFVVILLDTQLYVRGISEVARGARDRVSVSIPDVLRVVVVSGATAFVVAHNHPSGKINPSQADRDLTKSIKEAADAIGIPLFDHLVIGAEGYYSFADHRLL